MSFLRTPAVNPDPLRVTPAELAVLQFLWNRGPATIRQIADVLYPDGGVSEYYTVQKLLERLEEKRCVRKDRSQRAHVFLAAVGRDELLGEQLRGLSETLCGGSLSPLLTGLVQLRPLTSEEIGTLKELVHDLDRQLERRSRAGAGAKKKPSKRDKHAS
jgi:BlaI family penicillinase repressor